jgi:hypothetical protein
MKKIAVVVAILALVTPAMAAVTITTSTNSSDCTITIGYTSPDANLSGFALDCNVSDGNTIDDINDFHIGESNSTAKGFGIFPGSIDINSTTAAVDDYGNPVAPNSDPGALGGLGTGGVTIEMGALYEDGNQPGTAGTLCTLVVSATCKMKIALNSTRGGIVKEDSNDATVSNLPLTVDVPCVSLCTVPNILGMGPAEANTAITNAGLSVGTIDYNNDCSTYARDTVMAQSPSGGSQVSCNPTPVNYTLSSGCFPWADPNYSTWLSVGEPNCWCYPRQCHGDCDDHQDGDPKSGYFYVYGGDLNMVIAGWKTAYGGNPAVDTWICADFTHKQYGDPKGGYFRVYGDDLNMVIANWKSNPAANCPANCPK